MATQFTNFTYDPLKQGFDTSIWRKMSGTPVVFNQLVFSAAAAIHSADILKGRFLFNVNVPNTPKSGDVSSWGLYSISRGAYILFDINGATFSAKTSDGETSSSSVITWDPSWSDVNTNYTIQWEAGTAKFFINGGQVACISDASIPNITMGLYVTNTLATDLTVKYISCNGIQSYILVQDVMTSAADIPLPIWVAQPEVSKSESITITESVVVSIATNPAPSDTVTITENVAIVRI